MFTIVEEKQKEMEGHASHEAEKSLNEGRQDWASLPLPVVDSLVRVLKDTRRWRLEGRSLRLLNRHWSVAVTMHVNEIRPDATRIIADEDLASLSKFERVTSVDILPFLTHPSRYTVPKDSKQKKLYLKNWYDAKLERIVDRLRQLPQLTQIEVGPKAMRILHYHCSKKGEHFSVLERITSVYFYGSEKLKLYGDTYVSTTSMWRPPHQTADYSSTLAQMLGSLKRLESLEMDGSVLMHCRQFDFLDEAKHVTLRGVSFEILSRLPNPSASTVSVVASPSFGGFALDALVQLNRLSGLTLIAPTQENMIQLSRRRVARYLKVLSIYEGRGVEDKLVILNEVCHSFEQLECLNVQRCRFDGTPLRGTLPNLKSLKIENCTLTDSDSTFVSQFEKLEVLCWKNVHTPNLLPDLEYPETLRLPWEKMRLPNLRSLTVVPVLEDSELMFISQQTNLEVLHIVSGNHRTICDRAFVTSKGIHALQKLHNVRILLLQSFSQREIWLSMLSANFVARLEQLWLRCIITLDSKDGQLLEHILRKSPHMILKVNNLSRPLFLSLR